MMMETSVYGREHRYVARLLAASTNDRIPLTFRSGGTSLSGQASTDGVLVDTRRSFRRIEVLGEGAGVAPGPHLGEVEALMGDLALAETHAAGRLDEVRVDLPVEGMLDPACAGPSHLVPPDGTSLPLNGTVTGSCAKVSSKRVRKLQSEPIGIHVVGASCTLSIETGSS